MAEIPDWVEKLLLDSYLDAWVEVKKESSHLIPCKNISGKGLKAGDIVTSDEIEILPKPKVTTHRSRFLVRMMDEIFHKECSSGFVSMN